jgi:farnesyl diphosphate synthase
VLGAGKRVRPLLVHAAGSLTGAPAAALASAGCAVELIHAYSLVHDDLPCMDTDVLRRGKPTVHVAYGEALAMLVGKFSGKFTEELRLDATPAEYLQYITPACGQTTIVGVECEANGEYNGKPQYKYKMMYSKGSQKPVINNIDLSDAPPF